jgi:hypothetical protein
LHLSIYAPLLLVIVIIIVLLYLQVFLNGIDSLYLYFGVRTC